MTGPDVPSDLGTVFGVADALRRGVGASRLRSGELRRPFRGVRALSSAGGPGQPGASPFEIERTEVIRRAGEYRPVMPEGAFYVGPTAAALLGLPIPLGLQSVLYVGVLHPRTAPARPGIRGIQVLPRMARTIIHDDFAVTDPATTWAMLGAHLRLYDLVAVADAAIRIPRMPGRPASTDARPLATPADLQSALDVGRRRGAAVLREALSRARTGASSRPETWVRLILVDAGLPEPVLDHDIFDAHGRFVGCVDAAYPEVRVAIEYEGRGHLEGNQLRRDIDKYTDLDRLGWTTVRLVHSHVFEHPQEAVRRVRAALGARPH